MSIPYLNPFLNPYHPEIDILTFPNPDPNSIRNEFVKLDRAGKYVLKLPHASWNKDRKHDQKKKVTPTNISTKISETKISQTLLELRKTRDGKADQVRERNRIFR
jgi:hypothetical protein